MRRNQLNMTLESFGENATNGKRNKLFAYIDWNNLYEVLQQELQQIHKIYFPEISFEEFCDNVKKFNGNRFGRTDIKLKEE